jgi:hypothetical protein
MSVTLKFDSSRFQKDFLERVEHSRFQLHDVTNRVAFGALQKADLQTRVAERAEIEKLGVIGKQLFTKGVGKNHTGAGRLLKTPKNIYASGDQLLRATNIFIAQLRTRGINPRSIPAHEMQKAVQKFIAARLRAVGSVANRFTPALKKLKNAIRISYLYVPYKGPVRGRQKSRVSEAKPGWSPVCKFEVDVDTGDPHQSSESKSRVEEILKKAVDDGMVGETYEMEKFAKEAIDQVWRK